MRELFWEEEAAAVFVGAIRALLIASFRASGLLEYGNIMYSVANGECQFRGKYW
jgi:hypothetical protein